ncbi:hydrogenase maturation protease [Rhodocyclaceae bacterium SMB388]
MAPPRVVVIGVGNPSRGDDALGPLLLDRIEDGFPGVVVRRDFQLQIEHSLDLFGADLVLFVDAITGSGAQRIAFHEIRARANASALSHAVAPEVVLDVFLRVYGEPAPPAFVLGLRGETFELGADLSAIGRDALEAGWDLVQSLLGAPSLATWRDHEKRNGQAIRAPEGPCKIA